MKKFLQTFKEELIVIPLFAITIYVYHYFMSVLFPESAQFDLVSEIENIIWAVIKLIVYTSLSWVALRVVFPGFYKYLVEDYRNDFKGLKKDDKRLLSIGIWFAFLMALVLLS